MVNGCDYVLSIIHSSLSLEQSNLGIEHSTGSDILFADEFVGVSDSENQLHVGPVKDL